MVLLLALVFREKNMLTPQSKTQLRRKFKKSKHIRFLIFFVSIYFNSQCSLDPESQDSYPVNSPSALSLSADERLYVSDSRGHHIEVYSASSSFITKFGRMGDADGEFNHPSALLHHSNGNLYIADSFNGRIQVFNAAAHQFVTSFGSIGDEDGEFAFPTGMASDASGNLYVVDHSNHRIQVFDTAAHQFTASFGSEGDEDGEFAFPQDIAIDASGNLYVVDSSNHRIQIFNTSTYAYISSIGSRGRGDGEFILPRRIAIDDAAGELYIVDAPYYLASFSASSTRRDSAIQVFASSSGMWLRNFVINVPSSKRVRGAVAVFVIDIALADQKLYILDAGNDAVHIFQLTGEYVQSVDLIPIFDFF